MHRIPEVSRLRTHWLKHYREYRSIQDFPLRGRATYLHVRKRKWFDKGSGEVFSYGWELSEYDETRLNAEFVAFLKEGD